MIIIIPTRKTVQATIDAQTLNAVQCEKCSQHFGYVLKRKVVGEVRTGLLNSTVDARNDARAAAAANVNAALNDIDPVYCPHCGWMQEEMVTRYKRNYLRRFRNVARYFLVLGGIFVLFTAVTLLPDTRDEAHRGQNVIPPIVPAIPAGTLILAGTAMLLFRRSRVQRLAPNSLPLDTRLALAQKSCLTDSQIKQLQADSASNP